MFYRNSHDSMRSFAFIAILLLCASIATANFLPVYDDDDSTSASTLLSSSFNFDTDVRTNSEQPSDPDHRNIVLETRVGLHDDFSHPGWDDDDDTTSDAPAVNAGVAMVVLAMVVVNIV